MDVQNSLCNLILSNTFNIVMAVFDVSQASSRRQAGSWKAGSDVSADMLAELETSLETMDLGPLLGLWLQSSSLATMKAMEPSFRFGVWRDAGNLS